MNKKVIGLTGGIASGKTAVSDAFAGLGIDVIDADLIAREVVMPGQPALAAIVQRFDDEVLNNDGTLDRKKLRSIVFADNDARNDLEKILHPRIREMMHGRAIDANSAYVIAAIPLLTEVGARKTYPWIDRILVVDVPRAVQIDRLCQRDGIDLAAAEKMLAAQAGRQQRLAIADDVLINDASIDHLQQIVMRLDRLYR